MDYTLVKTTVSLNSKKYKSSWRPLLRQLFVCSGVCSIYFVLGLCFGAPAVFVPQIRNEINSTIILSDDMVSWLTSVHGYSALPWVLIVPVLAQMFGRKILFLTVTFSTLIGFIVFYFSTNAIQLLISEIMQGILLASNITLLAVIVAEYTTPHYRGVFLTVKSTIFFVGVFIANLVGTFLHWKSIAFIAIICSLYSFTAIFWPESPSWLAMKGRYDECAASHYWLKGFDDDSETELSNLIKSQKEYFRICVERKRNETANRVRSIMKTVSSRAFYKPLLLCMSFMSLYNFSGKLVCSMYAVDLIHKITDNESTAYTGMLIMDGITILGMLFGCVLCKYLKRRTLVIGSSLAVILFLIVISLYLFLVKLQVILENKFVSICLLTCFTVSVSCGPMLLPGCLFRELVFLRYKCSSLLLLTLYSEFLMATVLKLSPYLFELLTIPGAFLFYGISVSIFTIILWKYLPETKDKSLLDIEAHFEAPCVDDDDLKILNCSNDKNRSI